MDNPPSKHRHNLSRDLNDYYARARMCYNKRTYTGDEVSRVIRQLKRRGVSARSYPCPICKTSHITYTRVEHHPKSRKEKHSKKWSSKPLDKR